MRSPYSYLKLFTILFPTFLIGAVEYIRHEFWLDSLSMEVGNVLITITVFLLSCWFASWMFRRIEVSNVSLAEEKARRAVYEERERLAGELHDNIAQALFFLNVKLQKGHTEEAKSAVSEINNHLRQAIYNLRALPEETVHFEARLRSWLEEWSGMSGIPCSVRIELAEDGFTTAQEVQLFGLVQEAFTNIRKHSRAGFASLALMGKTGSWSLCITDNGVGIPEEELGKDGTAGTAGKYGISMMAKRAEAAGAGLTVRRMAEGGTKLVVQSEKGGIAP